MSNLRITGFSVSGGSMSTFSAGEKLFRGYEGNKPRRPGKFNRKIGISPLCQLIPGNRAGNPVVLIHLFIVSPAK